MKIKCLHWGQLLLWFVAWLPAQGAVPGESLLPPGTIHKAWTTLQGLPSDRVKDIVQTADGYLWLGTSDGLARFDGMRFTVFNRQNESAFTSNDCWALALDDRESLWIASPEGLVCYRDGHFQHYGINDGLTDEFIGTIAFGRKTGLWVATMNGLSRYQDGSWRTYRISQHGLKARVLRVHEDPSGRVWIGTIAGLQLFSAENGNFLDDLLPAPYTSERIFGIQGDPAGAVWVLSSPPESALYHFLQLNETHAVEISEGFQSSAGRTVLGTEMAPSRLWRPEEKWLTSRWLTGEQKKELRLPVPPHDVVMSLLEDREGNLWLGTLNSGLHRFRFDTPGISRLQNHPRSETTWAVLQDRQTRIWAGSDEGLISWSGAIPSALGFRDELSDNYVRALALDDSGALLIGTTDGLDRFENGRMEHVETPGADTERKIRAIVCARDGALWLGTDNGVFRLSDGKWIALHKANGLEDVRVPVLAEDPSGDIWIGTVAGGLYRWRAGELLRISSNHGLQGSSVSTLFIDSVGLLWIGTERGISRLTGDRFEMLLPIDQSPISSPVRAIVEDDANYFWIYSRDNLCGVRRSDLMNARRKSPEQIVTTFQIDTAWRQGPAIPKSQPVGCKTSDGRILFAGTHGLLAIDPRAYRRTVPPPSVTLEQVLANGETVYANGPIGFDGQRTPVRAGTPPILKLPPGFGNHLEIHFTVNTFADSERLRFKYRLEGEDSEWIGPGLRRVAYYSGLSPGNYRFQVMVCDPFQDWPESTSVLPIELAAHLHENRWVRTLAVLAVGSLLAAGAGWRRRKLRVLQALDQEAALTRERARLARDLHDQLGAELTRAARLSERLHDRPGDGLPERNRLHQSLCAMRQGIDAIVWAVSPDKDHVASMFDFTADRAQRLLEGTGVELIVRFPEGNLGRSLNPECRHDLAMVILEAVSNALRHGQPRRIEILFTLTPSKLIAEVVDDGCGFVLGTSSPGPLRHGMASMNSRVQRLGGEIRLESTPGSGTRVCIQLPFATKSSGTYLGRFL